VGIFLLTGDDALHLRQGGHIREAIDPEHNRLAGPGDPSLADYFRLPAGADNLGDVVDADRPSLDKTLHITLCDDALAGLDVDVEHTLGILHAADVLEGWIVVTHGVSHHIIIGGRDDILTPRGAKVIRNYLLCIHYVCFTQIISALRASPTTRFARIEGSPCGRLTGACDRFAPATPSLRSVAASAELVIDCP